MEASLSAVGLSHSDIDWAGPLHVTPPSLKPGWGVLFLYMCSSKCTLKLAEVLWKSQLGF